MSLQRVWLPTAILFSLIATGANLCAAQDPAQPQPDQNSPTPVTAQPANPPAAQPAAPTQPSPDQSAPVGIAPAHKTYTVPAGTKVLLELRSAINTKSAKPGDGVYLSSTFPVVVGNRVMIPAGVYVQGVVDRVVRGGRIKGKAQLDMHFTSIIFPNGSVVEIPGVVDSMPGAKNQTVKEDGEGTIQQNGDKGRNAGQVAEIALPTGAGVGTIGGAASGHPIEGGLAGLGAGLATVGMVYAFHAQCRRRYSPRHPGGDGPATAPVPGRGKPGWRGPTRSRAPVGPCSQPAKTNYESSYRRILCPPGGLGCE